MNWKNININNYQNYFTEKEKLEIKTFSDNLKNKLLKEQKNKKEHKENLEDIELAQTTLISLNQWRCHY